MASGRAPSPVPAAPYLGLTVEQKNGAVYAKEVAKGSPAEQAGITAGTEILELNGKKVDSVRAYLAALKRARVGKTLAIKTKRGDKVEVVSAKLAAHPAK